TIACGLTFATLQVHWNMIRETTCWTLGDAKSAYQISPPGYYAGRHWAAVNVYFTAPWNTSIQIKSQWVVPGYFEDVIDLTIDHSSSDRQWTPDKIIREIQRTFIVGGNHTCFVYKPDTSQVT